MQPSSRAHISWVFLVPSEIVNKIDPFLSYLLEITQISIFQFGTNGIKVHADEGKECELTER